MEQRKGPAGMHSLSPELLELVLAPLDRTSLLALQRTARVFLEPTRRFLFRTLKIKDEDQLESLLDEFRGNPALAVHVKELDFDFSLDISSLYQVRDAIYHCDHCTSIALPRLEYDESSDEAFYAWPWPQYLQKLVIRHTDYGDLSPVSSFFYNPHSSQIFPASILAEPHQRLGMVSFAFPIQLRPILFAPKSLTSLVIDAGNIGIATPVPFVFPEHQIASPFPQLESFELINALNVFPSSVVRWILKDPALAGRVNKLKFWSALPNEDVLATVKMVRSSLQEFIFKPTTTDLANTLLLLPHLRKVRKLTLGPGAWPKASSTSFSPTHILSAIDDDVELKQLCIAVGRGEVKLPLITNEIKTGKLKKLRSLELYDQIYFAPPVALSFRDTGTPTTWMHELRLSHLEQSKPEEITSLVNAVAPNLRIISLHHVNASHTSLLSPCIKLNRIELGVALKRNEFGFDALVDYHMWGQELSFLRFHFSSLIDLDDILTIVQDGSIPNLRTIDITGLFPTQVPHEWKTSTFTKLFEEAADAKVELCLNGKHFKTAADLWSVVLDHARGL